MTETLHPSSHRVQEAVRALGFSCRVQELPGSTRTALEAAQAVGCEVAQIAKSLVFEGQQSGRPLLVIASGSNRVDEATLTRLAGEPVAMANAESVRRHTGFAIGGVPPVGHPQPLTTWIDEDLLKYSKIWAAAGTPRSVFPLCPADLPQMTGGQVVRVAKPQKL